MQEITKLARELQIPHREQEPMALHTSFAIGGPARLFTSPRDSGQIAELIKVCQERRIKYFVIGRGSNLLVDDRGYDGVIIEIGTSFTALSREENRIRCGAGVPLTKLALFAAQEGLAGLAFSYGIPGSVGGAVFMNAGAYGGEMKDCILEVTHLNENGEEYTDPKEKLELGYRKSSFSCRSCVITEAVFDLREGDPEVIRTEMEQYMTSRREKQPLEMPSAGSTFMRPPGYFAGSLIEQCGLKGYRIGGAEVSKKHAGFIVNAGGATAKDVLALIEHIQKTVEAETSVHLECEVKYLAY